MRNLSPGFLSNILDFVYSIRKKYGIKSKLSTGNDKHSNPIVEFNLPKSIEFFDLKRLIEELDELPYIDRDE